MPKILSPFSSVKHLLASCLLLTTGALATSTTVYADFIDGNALQLYCTSQNPTDDAICIVYITGAVDAFTTVDLFSEKSSDNKRVFCMPEGIQPDALKTTTMTWMQRPDANLDFAATLLIWGAMKNSYGCPE
ncbi:Rap1a/Tai family immunity protein [Candidatus Puniceispirillum sp.]|uniref:Rap1a/Tai family immunity protein n=1 Tax=Candidatus Puniceispirillum sp. TaxID=2026719 RepID=UPI003F69F5A5